MSELSDVNISVVNDVFIKQIVFPYVGYTMMTHAHVYDHQTLLASGAVHIMVEGIGQHYTAPAILVIQAGKHHSIQSTAEGTVSYCIHAIKDGPLVQGIANDDLYDLA